MKKNKINVCHFIPGFSYFALFTAIAAKFCRVKIILESTRDGYDDFETLMRSKIRPLIKFALKNADYLVSISPKLHHKYLVSEYSEKTRLIANSVDHEKFSKVSKEEVELIKYELGVKPNVKVLVYVGIIRERKGIFDLIDIIHNLVKSHSNICLYCVGETDKDIENQVFFKRVLDKVTELELSNNIFFKGHSSAPHKWLQIADIFVFASKSEGFPNVIIEAMSTETPVIVKEINGITDYIIDNEYNGFIVPDNKSFVEISRKILDNENFCTYISQNARKSVLKRFTDDVIFSQYESLYLK